MTGIKETKEALVGLNELALVLLVAFKDGVQIGADASAIWNKFSTDPMFAAKLSAAYDGFKAIPEEVKDIDAMEGIELAKVQLDYVPQFVAAMKKA